VRNGNLHEVTCGACGHVVERKARQQGFCSERCRLRGHYLTSESENKSLYGLPSPNHSTDPPKNINDINANSHGIFGPRCVVAVEIVDTHAWREEVSAGGGCGFVTQLRKPALVERRRP
jgi:hypothetical protein